MKRSTVINNQGVQDFFHGDLQKAEAEFRQAIKNDPSNSSSYNNLAFILQQKGQLDEAEVQARTSVKLNDSSSTAWLNLGNILIQKGQGEEGAGLLVKAIETDATNVMAWESMATLSMMQQDYFAAEKCWEKTIILRPGESKYKIQQALVKVGLRKTDEAVALLRAALDEDPSNAFAWSQMGILQFLQNNFGLAEKAFMHALGLQPEDTNSRYHLALVHLANNRVNDAKNEFDRILLFEPKNVKVLTERGILELASGNEDDARKFLKQALQIDPNYTRAADYLAKLGGK